MKSLKFFVCTFFIKQTYSLQVEYEIGVMLKDHLNLCPSEYEGEIGDTENDKKFFKRFLRMDNLLLKKSKKDNIIIKNMKKKNTIYYIRCFVESLKTKINPLGIVFPLIFLYILSSLNQIMKNKTSS